MCFSGLSAASRALHVGCCGSCCFLPGPGPSTPPNPVPGPPEEGGTGGESRSDKRRRSWRCGISATRFPRSARRPSGTVPSVHRARIRGPEPGPVTGSSSAWWDHCTLQACHGDTRHAMADLKLRWWESVQTQNKLVLYRCSSTFTPHPDSFRRLSGPVCCGFPCVHASVCDL